MNRQSGLHLALTRLVVMSLCLVPQFALAQNQIYVHDISGPVRVWPLTANGDVPPSRTFGPINQGGASL